MPDILAVGLVALLLSPLALVAWQAYVDWCDARREREREAEAKRRRWPRIPMPPPYVARCRCALEPYGVSDWSTVKRLCPKHGGAAPRPLPTGVP